MIALPLAGRTHPIHVTVTDMKHNTDKNWLEITIKIFTDDFEDVLQERTGKPIRLGQEDEHQNTNTYIIDYLHEHFKITINEEPATLEFIGKEIEDVAVWCYLAIPDIHKVTSVTIANSVMMHWFDDQINVVHLDCNDKLNSTFFSKNREVETFRFK